MGGCISVVAEPDEPTKPGPREQPSGSKPPPGTSKPASSRNSVAASKPGAPGGGKSDTSVNVFPTSVTTNTLAEGSVGGASVEKPMGVASGGSSGRGSSKASEKGSVGSMYHRGGGEVVPAAGLRVFTPKELKRATRNFSRKLGCGGHGTVYRGRIAAEWGASGRGELEVAVKKLDPSSHQGMKEWQREVEILGALSHPNLVRHHGFCANPQSWMLVYEYMDNGSFDYHLFPSRGPPVGFTDRMKVAMGAALGLEFLHKSSWEQSIVESIIYRDFKTSNILVDKDFNAKLADFGLARYGPPLEETRISTAIVSTLTYVAPEYMSTGHVSLKCDVYSFGIFLLEILSGRKAFEPDYNPEEDAFLIDVGFRCDKTKDGVDRLIDPRLGKDYVPKAVRIVFKVAIACINEDPNLRPPMSDVVHSLKPICVLCGLTEDGRPAAKRSCDSSSP